MTLLSMNEITTYRWSFEEDVENYLEAGYGAIGVWRQKVADGDEDRAVELLASSGMAVSHLSWAGGFTGSEGRSLSESIADAQEALRFAAAIGAGSLVVYPGSRNNHTFRHAGRLLQSALDELLPLAEAVEVPIALEPIQAACAAGWTFLTDWESTLALLEQFESPYLKIAFDAYHFPVSGGYREVLRRLAAHLAIVHLSDCRQAPSLEQERCLLGAGRLPLQDIICTLQEAGYVGPFDIKLMGSDVQAVDYWTVLERSQEAFSELVPTPMHRSLT